MPGSTVIVGASGASDGTACDAIGASVATTLPVSAIAWLAASVYVARSPIVADGPIDDVGVNVTTAESVAPTASVVEVLLI
jgi:hypothetical protein